MKYFRNYISRFVLCIIALQILNMSIDSPSADLHTGQESDKNFNYIDTFVEYIAEVVLKYDNAIPESKDRQQKELQMHKQFEVVIHQFISPFVPEWKNLVSKQTNNYADQYAFQFIKEINPPPPKA